MAPRVADAEVGSHVGSRRQRQHHPQPHDGDDFGNERGEAGPPPPSPPVPVARAKRTIDSGRRRLPRHRRRNGRVAAARGGRAERVQAGGVKKREPNATRARCWSSGGGSDPLPSPLSSPGAGVPAATASASVNDTASTVTATATAAAVGEVNGCGGGTTRPRQGGSRRLLSTRGITRRRERMHGPLPAAVWLKNAHQLYLLADGFAPSSCLLQEAPSSWMVPRTTLCNLGRWRSTCVHAIGPGCPPGSCLLTASCDTAAHEKRATNYPKPRAVTAESTGNSPHR